MTFGQYSSVVKSNIRVMKSFLIQLTGITTYTVLASGFDPVLSRHNLVCTKLKLGSAAQPTKEISLLEFICVKNVF